MANKFGFFEDVGEQLLELGKSTAKKSVKAVVQTVNPLSLLDSKSSDSLKSPNTLKPPNSPKSTPLNLDKLQTKYQDQDKVQTEALRQRLFQMVKSGEEKLLMEKKQKEMEKKRQEAYAEQEKKRKQQEQQQQQDASIPQGKTRRSIFSKKKVAKREQAEVKPSSGKQ